MWNNLTDTGKLVVLAVSALLVYGIFLAVFL